MTDLYKPNVYAALLKYTEGRMTYRYEEEPPLGGTPYQAQLLLTPGGECCSDNHVHHNMSNACLHAYVLPYVTWKALLFTVCDQVEHEMYKQT